MGDSPTFAAPGNGGTEAPPRRERLRADFLAQTARIPFQELQRFFAAGRLLCVADELDLIDVAVAVAEDDRERVEGWIAAAALAPVGDTQARRWLEEPSELWAVVTDPWVLAQERRPTESP